MKKSYVIDLRKNRNKLEDCYKKVLDEEHFGKTICTIMDISAITMYLGILSNIGNQVYQKILLIK